MSAKDVTTDVQKLFKMIEEAVRYAEFLGIKYEDEELPSSGLSILADVFAGLRMSQVMSEAMVELSKLIDELGAEGSVSLTELLADPAKMKVYLDKHQAVQSELAKKYKGIADNPFDEIIKAQKPDDHELLYQMSARKRIYEKSTKQESEKKEDFAQKMDDLLKKLKIEKRG